MTLAVLGAPGAREIACLKGACPLLGKVGARGAVYNRGAGHGRRTRPNGGKGNHVEGLRIATIGTSGICARFCDALAECEGVELVGTYSRDLDRARSFGGPRGARLFFDDLDALAGSPEVDAVYVASPNALHASQTLRMIAGGKHVLVEKALASNEREAREVFDAARAAGVVALEATRSLHTPQLPRHRARRLGGAGPGAPRHDPLLQGLLAHAAPARG